MEEVHMERRHPSTPWGFRLNGGVDFHQRLSIQKVEVNSIAYQTYISVGDWIRAINGRSAEGLTHQEALAAIRQSGNHLSLNITRAKDINKTTETTRSGILYQSAPASFTNPALSPSSTVQSETDSGYSQSSNQIRQARYSYPPQGSAHPPAQLQASTPEADSVFSEEDLVQQFQNQEISNSPGSNMAYRRQSSQGEVPDQLLNQFNKRPEDKPFSYLPSGGMAELQQRQKAAPPPTRPKPRPSRQTSSSSVGSNDQQQKQQVSYDPESLFTPAYREMIKQQRERLQQPVSAPYSADMVGPAPDQIPPDSVAAYVLQPDGSMVALRWNDRPGPDMQNSAVMAAIMEEQRAQEQGYTSGRIRSADSGSKQGLSFRVLQWLTGTDSEDNSETMSNYSGSHDGMSQPGSRRMRQQSFDKSDFNQNSIREDERTSDLEHLYKGGNLPSHSFRRLLRSLSSNGDENTETILQESPHDFDGGRVKRNGIKVVSRGSSQDKSFAPSSRIDQGTAFCDL